MFGELGTYTTRIMLISLGELAEDVGIESIWVSEHLVVADPKVVPSKMDPEERSFDPVTALAFLAGRTGTVLLGTGVVVLPLRNPLILAKELATIDVLSGGRLLFGVGVGYVWQEFEALGVPFAGREERIEEYLGAIRSIWSDDHPSYAGRTVSFTGIQAHPRPLQRPGPPIVMGGYAPPVLRRAVREADGWFGWGLDPDETVRYRDLLRRPRPGCRGATDSVPSRSRSHPPATSTSRPPDATRRSASTA